MAAVRSRDLSLESADGRKITAVQKMQIEGAVLGRGMQFDRHIDETERDGPPPE
jgi:hypothetical protein